MEGLSTVQSVAWAAPGAHLDGLAHALALLLQDLLNLGLQLVARGRPGGLQSRQLWGGAWAVAVVRPGRNIGTRGGKGRSSAAGGHAPRSTRCSHRLRCAQRSGRAGPGVDGVRQPQSTRPQFRGKGRAGAPVWAQTAPARCCQARSAPWTRWPAPRGRRRPHPHAAPTPLWLSTPPQPPQAFAPAPAAQGSRPGVRCAPARHPRQRRETHLAGCEASRVVTHALARAAQGSSDLSNASRAVRHCDSKPDAFGETLKSDTLAALSASAGTVASALRVVYVIACAVPTFAETQHGGSSLG